MLGVIAVILNISDNAFMGELLVGSILRQCFQVENVRDYSNNVLYF